MVGAAPKLSVVFGLCRLIRHARQLLQDNEEVLCVRVLQTIKGMMCRDLDFGDKVICNFSVFLMQYAKFRIGEKFNGTGRC